jgi:hypothetical protein
MKFPINAELAEGGGALPASVRWRYFFNEIKESYVKVLSY